MNVLPFLDAPTIYVRISLLKQADALKMPNLNCLFLRFARIMSGLKMFVKLELEHRSEIRTICADIKSLMNCLEMKVELVACLKDLIAQNALMTIADT